MQICITPPPLGIGLTPYPGSLIRLSYKPTYLNATFSMKKYKFVTFRTFKVYGNNIHRVKVLAMYHWWIISFPLICIKKRFLLGFPPPLDTYIFPFPYLFARSNEQDFRTMYQNKDSFITWTWSTWYMIEIMFVSWKLN